MTLDFKSFPQLQTQRLTLRQVSLEDSPEVFGLRSDPETMRYIGRPLQITLEDASQYIKELLRMQANNEILFWAIQLMEAPTTMIGNICLWRFQKEHYRAEVGYMLNPSFVGKGYMKEAIDAVIKFAFKGLKLHSLEALINPLNKSSASVLSRAGFELEGHLKENYYYNGKFSDTQIYSLINKDSHSETATMDTFIIKKQL